MQALKKYEMRLKLNFCIIIGILMLVGSCKRTESSDISNTKSVLTKSFEPNIMIDWWKVIYKHVAYQRVKPPVASRIYSYVGVAAYEAALPGMVGYNSFVGQLTDLDDLPRPDPALVYDWPTVIIHTVYLSTDELLKRFVHGSESDFKNLKNKQLSARKLAVAEDVFQRSEEYGEKLATKLIEWIRKDNFDETRYYSFYKIPSRNNNPELWEPTEATSDPCEPFWDSIRPFFLDSGAQCHIPLKVPFSIAPDSEFRGYMDEVLEYDKNMTEEQRDIALFWADDPGETSTPPGHWTYIMNYAIQQEQFNLEQAVSTYALVGVGVADAFIASWYTKYKVNLVRPKTYAQEFLDMPDWEPLIETPPFPEYASGHSVVSTVAAELLTEIFGENYSLMDSTHVSIGLKPRKITSFRDAALEASMSRVYGGLHYMFSIDAGIAQGLCVKQTIVDKIKLRKDNTLNISNK